jgi:hypothetical protein
VAVAARITFLLWLIVAHWQLRVICITGFPTPRLGPGAGAIGGEAAAFKFGVPRAGAPELGPAGSTGHALGFGDSQQRAGQVR